MAFEPGAYSLLLLLLLLILVLVLALVLLLLLLGLFVLQFLATSICWKSLRVVKRGGVMAM